MPIYANERSCFKVETNLMFTAIYWDNQWQHANEPGFKANNSTMHSGEFMISLAVLSLIDSLTYIGTFDGISSLWSPILSCATLGRGYTFKPLSVIFIFIDESYFLIESISRFHDV